MNESCDETQQQMRLSLKTTYPHKEDVRETMRLIHDDEPFTLSCCLAQVMPFSVETNVDVLIVAMILITDPLSSHDFSKEWYWPALELMWKLRKEKHAKEEAEDTDDE